MGRGRRGQVWYGDYIIGVLMFSLMIIFYLEFTSNISQEESTSMTDLLLASKIISNDLMSEGSPPDWTGAAVQRFGLVTADRLDSKKIRRFDEVNYNESLYRFKTNYNYYAFLTDRAGTGVLVGGSCGAGSPLVVENRTSRDPIAWYSRAGGEQLFGAIGGLPTVDAYDDSNISFFFDSLPDYTLAVIEDPFFNATWAEELKKFMLKGGNVIATQDVLEQTGEFLEAQYVMNASCTNQQANITDDDPFINVSDGGHVNFTDCPHLEGIDPIASYEYDSDHAAIASWRYGNGWVYWLSDVMLIPVNTSREDFWAYLVDSLDSGTCAAPDLSAIGADQMISATRLIPHHADILKMEVYAWEG